MGKVRVKLLVVDDEPMLLDFISRILTDEGYDVDTAVDGEKALAKLVGNLYSLVILDIHIPSLSGIEV